MNKQIVMTNINGIIYRNLEHKKHYIQNFISVLGEREARLLQNRGDIKKG